MKHLALRKYIYRLVFFLLLPALFLAGCGGGVAETTPEAAAEASGDAGSHADAFAR